MATFVWERQGCVRRLLLQQFLTFYMKSGSVQIKDTTDVDRCPLSGIRLNQNGICFEVSVSTVLLV